MASDRVQFNAAVYLVLQKNNKILLLRRFNTGWQDGMYTLPAGHLEANETLASRTAMEAKEETGLDIKEEDLRVIHTVHHRGNKEYLDFYLSPSSWRGEISLTEPDKSDDIQWFPVDKLPENVLPNVKDVLERIKKGETFSEFVWPN